MKITNWLGAAILSLLFAKQGTAQQLKLGSNPYGVEKSAVLELQSTNQGLLFSRIADTALINAINPQDGTVIYFTPTKSLLLRSNGYWQPLAPAASLNNYWSINGNTNGAVKKLGTTDNTDLPLITNNTERMRITAAGKVGIGNSAPSEVLDVTGNLKFSGALMPNNSAGTAGQLLRSNGTGAAPSWTTLGLSNLSGVTIASPANGQLLQYNGTAWTNVTPSYLTSVDTTNIPIFSTKVRSLFSAVAPITYANGQIGITQATASTNGYLSSADWNTFNNKLSTVDTSNIPNFSIKVRNLFSAGSGITYNATTGAIAAVAPTNTWLYGGNTVTALKNFGTIDNFDLPFITNNTEKMRLTNAGRLGIGTNAPNNLLEVTGTNTTTGVSGLRLTNLGTATATAANSKVLSVNASGDVIVTTNAAVNNWLITGNSGINAASNFLGNIDDKQMILKSNNQSFLEFGRRQTLGLTQGYTDYTDNDEKVTYIRSALQFEAPNANFYKPKMFVDSNGNFRVKGSSAGTDYFEFGSTGTNNNGGFEFIIGDDGDEPIVFKSHHYINGMSEIMRLQSGRMAVGSNAFDATNPEKLLIDAGNTTSYNLMTGKGSIDNYLQINVQNRSAGGSASSDLVATSNNGSESINYIDMGINSGGYTNNSYPVLNGANNAYLYSTGNDLVMGNGTSGKNFRFFTGGFNTSNERMRIDGNGNVAIGSTAFDGTAPEKLLIDAGTTSSYNLINARGNINNYLQFNIQNESAGTSASTDIVATNNAGTETARFIDMGINSSNYSNVGILGGAHNAYLYSTGNDLIIGNATAGSALRFFTGGTATTNEYMRINSNGFVGIGTTNPGYPLDVERSGGAVASFNRTSSDGTIISLQQAGIEEGSITVLGTTVSFNAFTGSHYAWTNQQIGKGMLVTLTGDNQYLHDSKTSEIIYGIQPSAQANDPKILGAFLGLKESASSYSTTNPNLVMAVGNGVMWVVDKGEDLNVGDYLISSDVSGHAMKENGTYPTAYVIARVAEPVKWAAETTVINGVKHKLISVFFESFVKNNAQKELETLKQEVKDMKERLERLEKLATQANN